MRSQKLMNKNNLSSNQPDFILYISNDGNVKVEVTLQDETIWLTQKSIGELFGKSKATISEHIKKIYEEGDYRCIQLFGISEHFRWKDRVWEISGAIG